MKYLFVSALIPLKDSYGSGETKDYFNNLPKETYYVADVVDEETDLKKQGENCGIATKRKIDESGWPKYSKWTDAEIEEILAKKNADRSMRS